MKKTLLSIIGLLLMGELIAGHTKVTFYSTRGETFILTVNGQRVNHRPATSVHLDNLYPGKNRVHVRVQKRGRITEFRTPIFLEAGHRSKFAIQRTHGFGYRVEKVHVSPIYAKRRHHGATREYYYEGDHYRDDWYSAQDHGYRRELQTVNHVHVSMKEILYSLSYYHFDRDRLAYAKRAIAGKALYSGDVVRIMAEFSFDRYRLDFADFAYQSTIDKENYYKVKKGFRFRSTARDLDRRIYG